MCCSQSLSYASAKVCVILMPFTTCSIFQHIFPLVGNILVHYLHTVNLLSPCRKQETAAQLLADKSVVSAQKDRYNQYSMVSEEYIADGDYDDEYDDTYDGNQVGANDADSDDELISRR